MGHLDRNSASRIYKRIEKQYIAILGGNTISHLPFEVKIGIVFKSSDNNYYLYHKVDSEINFNTVTDKVLGFTISDLEKFKFAVDSDKSLIKDGECIYCAAKANDKVQDATFYLIVGCPYLFPKGFPDGLEPLPFILQRFLRWYVPYNLFDSNYGPDWKFDMRVHLQESLASYCTYAMNNGIHVFLNKGEKIPLTAALIDELAAVKYEGISTKATIYCSGEQPSNLSALFHESENQGVKLRRKLLQLGNERYYPVYFDGVIKGLVDKNHISSKTFLVEIGNDSWKLRYNRNQRNTVTVMSSVRGNLKLGEYKSDPAILSIIYKRIFEKDVPQNISDIMESAKFQNHGTMIVVSASAKDEIKRLPCIKGDYAYSSMSSSKARESFILSLTSIDGALICDPSGKITAIGAILDGAFITGMGDMNRGARYNSAIKYTKDKSDCLILVVSEDGYIDYFHDGKRIIE